METRGGVYTSRGLAVREVQGPVNVSWGWFWFCLLLDEGDVSRMEGPRKDEEMKSIEEKRNTDSKSSLRS